MTKEKLEELLKKREAALKEIRKRIELRLSENQSGFLSNLLRISEEGLKNCNDDYSL